MSKSQGLSDQSLPKTRQTENKKIFIEFSAVLGFSLSTEISQLGRKLGVEPK